jgi:hypothetical protein
MLSQDVTFTVSEEVTIVELAIIEEGVTVASFQLKLLFGGC